MYNEQLKQEVLNARKEYGYSVPKLVEKFGVARPTIYLWLKEEKENTPVSDKSKYPILTRSEEDREEYELTIQQLKDKITELEEQNATLMKTLKLLVDKN